MSQPLRIGLVGCGRLGEVGYVPALAAAAGVTLVAVAERDPDRRARVGALAGVPAFPDAAELLARVPVDGLVLATPVGARLAEATAASAAGVALLVEKPPAEDHAGAARLAQLTPPPWVGFNRRFSPAAQRLRAAVPPDGQVLVDLELRYRRRGWGAHTVTDDALLDLGPHLIDLARWLTGAEVVAVRRATVLPERAELELLLGEHRHARARVRCTTDRPHAERFAVRDRRGRTLAAARTGGLSRAVWQRLGTRRRPHPLTASLTAQVEAFARAARGAPEPLLGRAADGLAVMAVVDAARACAAAGGRLMTITTEE